MIRAMFLHNGAPVLLIGLTTADCYLLLGGVPLQADIEELRTIRHHAAPQVLWLCSGETEEDVLATVMKYLPPGALDEAHIIDRRPKRTS